MDLNNPNIPIIGEPKAGGPNAPGLTVNCEVHDSEIIEIERILLILEDRGHNRGRIDLDAFDREIKDRFHKLGFIAEVTWWHTNVEGVKIPDITISDRTEAKEFDHDQKVHEVTKDILGLGDQGVIKSNLGEFPEHGHDH